MMVTTAREPALGAVPVFDGHARPVVVASQCLGFAAVRYNGEVPPAPFVQALRDHVRFIQVCPEVGIGLGVPRDPIRIVHLDGERRLVQPSTGLDLTDRMHRFSTEWLHELGAVDGFVLKGRSPSCAVRDAKVYGSARESAPPLPRREPGLFARAVLERFPAAAVEDERRLADLRVRHHFLVRLFASARLREAAVHGLDGLRGFHSEHELQWTAYGRTGLRELGRIAANATRRRPGEALEVYRERFARHLARPAGLPSSLRALRLVLVELSDRLSPSERRRARRLMARYRSGGLPLQSVLGALGAREARLPQDRAAVRRYLEPYPPALLALAASEARTA